MKLRLLSSISVVVLLSGVLLLAQTRPPWVTQIGASANIAVPISPANGGTGVSTAPANQIFAGPASGAAAAGGFRLAVLADLPAIPSAGVYNNAVQSIPSSVDTALAFNTEDYNVGPLHSNISNNTRFTVPTGGAGLYHACAVANFVSNAATFTSIYWRKNGTTPISSRVRQAGIPAATSGVENCATATLADADYLEAITFQNVGVGLNSGDNSSRVIQNSAQVDRVP